MAEQPRVPQSQGLDQLGVSAVIAVGNKTAPVTRLTVALICGYKQGYLNGKINEYRVLIWLSNSSNFLGKAYDPSNHGQGLQYQGWVSSCAMDLKSNPSGCLPHYWLATVALVGTFSLVSHCGACQAIAK